MHAVFCKAFVEKEIMLYLNQSTNMKYKFLPFIFALAVSVPVFAQQKVNTIAGNGGAGFSGDGFHAVSAQLWGPIEVALDKSGNVYINDHNNYRIRKVNTIGVITTVAGTGTAGNSGNGSVATSADIFARGMAVDHRYNIFFSDPSSDVIRRVNSSGKISKYAGGGTTGAQTGYSGDGGKADTARFKNPHGICVDDTGNMYIADAGNHVIRKIDTFGFVSTVAGDASLGSGYFGDGGIATMAQLDSPYAVAVDHKGNLYINDFNNNVIRRVDVITKTITTITDNTGTPGYTGDNGLSTAATINAPRGMCVDLANSLFFADAMNNVIRKIDTFGIITTVAGNGWYGFGGDLGLVTGANFKNPYAVAVDGVGSIHIADANNNRIRKTYSTTGVNGISASNSVAIYPNPFSEYFVVSGLTATDKVIVYDITGRQVAEAVVATNTGTVNIAIANKPAGVYVMQVNDAAGNRKAMLKVIKE
ncbi:MAG: Leucinerich repeat protein-like protein [Flavipsychrobacter sp.]|jgi:hypothetical protein|nr:Leucinerich repeat protein-like protein [Flavipsychrobacter sp.]